MVVIRFDGVEAVIDTWVMSCRVFSRQMEDFAFKIIWKIARDRGCNFLRGSFVPTQKNGVVAGLYEHLGGIKAAAAEGQEESWSFELNGTEPMGTANIRDLSLPTS